MLLLIPLAAAIPGAPRAKSVTPSGSILLTQEELTVQTKESFEWIYVVGDSGLAVDDSLIINDPVFHGMRWSKWGELTPYYDLCDGQTNSGIRASNGLISAYAARSGEALEDIELLVERSNCNDLGSCNQAIHENGWTTVTVSSGTLEDGDTVHVIHGDVEGCYEVCEAEGSKDCSQCELCGFEAPDRSFPAIWWYGEECLGGADCVELEPAQLSVKADNTLNEVLVVGPSMVAAGEDFALKSALLDPFGNPILTGNRTLTVTFEAKSSSGNNESYTLAPDDGGWHDFDVRLDDPGIYRIRVTASSGEFGISNPIEVTDGEPPYRIYWGDIHTHHGYTFIDEGQRRDFNHDYGRDVVGLDVVSESIKADGIEIDAVELWSELQDSCTQYSVDGDYLVLLGFEWIGDDAARAKCGSAAKCSEGHHNIYYSGCNGPLATQDVSQIDGLDGPKGLWTWLDLQLENTGLDAVSIPHAMRWTYFNFDIYYGAANEKEDVEPGYPGVQTLVEVYSEWGDGTGDASADGSVQQMVAKGHRVGWIGGSDNHDGWMGNPYSTQGVFGGDAAKSGLGAFLAPDLTRADIFEAMKNRQTYATGGSRPIIHFSVTDGEGKDATTLHQGSELLAEAPVLTWAYHGTATIQSLRLFRQKVGEAASPVSLVVDEKTVLDSEGSLDLSEKSKSFLDGSVFWIEVLQTDGEKAWSSPIWLTSDCDRIELGAQDPLGLCDPIDTGDTGPIDTDPPEDTDTDVPEDSAGSDSGDGPELRCSCRGAGPSTALLLTLFVGLRRRVRRS